MKEVSLMRCGWKKIHQAVDSRNGFMFEVGECFGETAARQVMPQTRIAFVDVRLRPCRNFLRDMLERVKMSGGIAIPPRVIGDDGLTMAKELDQIMVHGRSSEASGGLLGESVYG